MVGISTEIAGLKLRNPLMPGSSPIVRDGSSLVEVANKGAGALVSETVSVEPAEVPRPNMTKVGDSLINAHLWSEVSLEQWIKKEFPKALDMELPVVASIGYSSEEVSEVAPKVEEVGVNALEIPTKYFAEEPPSLAESVSAAKAEVDIPVFAKLDPNVSDIVEVAKDVESAGADGIVAISPLGPTLAIQVHTERPIMGSGNGYGWLTGPSIKPIAVRCVADIAREVDIPVIGAGGIKDERDVAEFLMAGASAVQISTAAIVRGTKIFGLIADNLTRFIRGKGYDSIEGIRGVALKNLTEEPLRTTAKQPEILSSRCNASSLCKKYCPYDAVKIVGGTARIDSARCTGCGLCVSVCPNNAIRF